MCWWNTWFCTITSIFQGDYLNSRSFINLYTQQLWFHNQMFYIFSLFIIFSLLFFTAYFKGILCIFLRLIILQCAILKSWFLSLLPNLNFNNDALGWWLSHPAMPRCGYESQKSLWFILCFGGIWVQKLDEGRFEGEKMQKETCTVYDCILCGSRRNILKHRKNDG